MKQSEVNYQYLSEELSENYLALLFGTPFNKEGVNYYGDSRFLTESQFEKLLSKIHPTHLEQDVHFVFFRNRRQFIRKLFSKQYNCRQDFSALYNGNPNALFVCENNRDTFVYFYDFNQEKNWEQTMMVAAILSILYEKNHPDMPEKKRRKKRELYVYRMLRRFNEK